MPVTIEAQAGGKILVVHATGKLHADDYATFVPQVEQLIAQHGKIRIIFDLHDFHGWSPDALWQDIKFDARHFADIERLAIVGESAWERAIAAACRPFSLAKIRYFDRSEISEANDWIRDNVPVKRRSA